MLLGLVLLLLHLAQLWLVRTWECGVLVLGGGHQVTDRNPACSTADDLCSSFSTDVMERPLCCSSYAVGSGISA